jgi:threonylcarbamoyladenosine tRNA methylthiotransferase MtaB
MQMRREYTLPVYMEIVDQLRTRYPLFNFTTDIMVGFPGEAEKDFEATCKVVREVGFSHVHTFKYSVRKGTRAARMEEQIPAGLKNDRSIIIRDLASENKLKYRKRFTGLTQTVLVENINDGIAKGYGENYVPVEFKNTQPEKNYFQTVTIKNISSSSPDYVLIG